MKTHLKPDDLCSTVKLMYPDRVFLEIFHIPPANVSKLTQGLTFAGLAKWVGKSVESILARITNIQRMQQEAYLERDDIQKFASPYFLNTSSIEYLQRHPYSPGYWHAYMVFDQEINAMRASDAVLCIGEDPARNMSAALQLRDDGFANAYFVDCDPEMISEGANIA